MLWDPQPLYRAHEPESAAAAAARLRPSGGDDDLRLSLIDLSDFHPAELSDFQPALTPFRTIRDWPIGGSTTRRPRANAPNAGSPVARFRRVMRRAHQHPQLPIALRVRRFRAAGTTVVPACRHAGHLAHVRNRKDRLPRVNQANVSLALSQRRRRRFLRISRSSRSCRFSLCATA